MAVSLGSIRELIDRLAAHQGQMVASVYLPTEVAGPEVEQNRIRLRNQLARTEQLLEELGWKPRQREEYLAEARELLEGELFWKRDGHGLGLFIDPDGGVEQVVLHHPVPERVVVADRYHVRPLLPGLDPVEVDVLVLTLGGVRLYRAGASGLTAVEADLPGSFEDVNWFVDRERQRQQHPNARGEKRARHGHDPAERLHADVERFLDAIDEALPRSSEGRHLIVLGVDDLVDRFLALRGDTATSPPNSGVGDAEDMNQVRDKVLPLLDSMRREREEAEADRARAELGRGNGYVVLDEALPAAVSGRIGELVISESAPPIWGSFDESTGEARAREKRELGDVDLLDRLAVTSMRHGARVGVVGDAIDGHDWVALARF